MGSFRGGVQWQLGEPRKTLGNTGEYLGVSAYLPRWIPSVEESTKEGVAGLPGSEEFGCLTGKLGPELGAAGR